MSRNALSGETENRRIYLGAFGKHPGWDDHIEDIGLDTPALVAFKRLLYMEGIGRNIDGGMWSRLPEDARLDGFRHVFLWHDAGGLILGRMWASRDGKGRALYPMVVCMECQGVSETWILEHGLPRLAALQREAQGLRTAEDVCALIREARAGLNESAAADTAGSGLLPAWCSGRGALDSLGADPAAFHRILYKIEREFTPYCKGAVGRERPAAHARVPAGLPDEHGALLLWAGLLLTLIEEDAPLFMVHPVGEPWQDIVLGATDSRPFFCLLAALKAIPLVTTIPYTLAEEFVKRATETADSWRRSDVAFGPLLRPVAPERNGRSARSFLSSFSSRMGGLFRGGGRALDAGTSR